MVLKKFIRSERIQSKSLKVGSGRFSCSFRIYFTYSLAKPLLGLMLIKFSEVAFEFSDLVLALLEFLTLPMISPICVQTHL